MLLDKLDLPGIRNIIPMSIPHDLTIENCFQIKLKASGFTTRYSRTDTNQLEIRLVPR